MMPQSVPAPDERRPEPNVVVPAGVVAHGSWAAHRLEALRVSLLQHAAHSPHGLTVSAFHLCVCCGGLGASTADVARELQYLLDKGLLVAVPKAISPENGRYRLHATGRDLLAEYGLTGEDEHSL